MKNSLYGFYNKVVTHIAIPAHDLVAAEAFYTEIIGASLCRSYRDRRTFGLYNLQIVCHLTLKEKIDWNPDIYPKHFGITFEEKASFEAIVERCRSAQCDIRLDCETRFPGQPEEHLTFIVQDPSHNLIEFKFYYDGFYAF